MRIINIMLNDKGSDMELIGTILKTPEGKFVQVLSAPYVDYEPPGSAVFVAVREGNEIKECRLVLLTFPYASDHEAAHAYLSRCRLNLVQG